MLNKGKGKRKGKNKGKGKDEGGKDKTVTCYTCGQQGHISPNCPTKKGGKGNKGKKGGLTMVNGMMERAINSHNHKVISSRATVVTVDSH
eukprot:1597205-Amphidinium_carterae.1